MQKIENLLPETITQLTPDALPPSLKLENLSPDYDTSFHPECASAAAEAVRFVESVLQSRPAWCSLLGVSGAGKTMLSKAANHYLRGRGMKSRFIRWITIVDYMRKGDFGVIDFVCDAPIAFIDDIGAGYETEMSKAKILEIAERRTGKSTFWTSNLTAEQIAEQIDVRVASRMVRGNNRIFQFMECPDWSLQNYNQNP